MLYRIVPGLHPIPLHPGVPLRFFLFVSPLPVVEVVFARLWKSGRPEKWHKDGAGTGIKDTYILIVLQCGPWGISCCGLMALCCHLSVSSVHVGTRSAGWTCRMCWVIHRHSVKTLWLNIRQVSLYKTVDYSLVHPVRTSNIHPFWKTPEWSL